LTGDEITMRGYMVLTFVECTTAMIAKLAVTSGHGSYLRLDGMVLGMELFWYGYDMVLVQDDFWCSCVELCDL
jgi:hypothetical protein